LDTSPLRKETTARLPVPHHDEQAVAGFEIRFPGDTQKPAVCAYATRMRRYLPFLLIAAVACQESGPATPSTPPRPAAGSKTATPAVKMTPEEEVVSWKEKRRTNLLKEDGWLTLVGLTWLNPGDNEVKLPAHPPVVAHFSLQNGKVTLTAPVQGAPQVLRDDTDPAGPQNVRMGTFRFNVIKRNDRYALRMKDSEAEARSHFKGLEYFPFDPKWRIEGHFEPYNPPHKIAITNVLGMTSDEIAPGAITFDVAGKPVRIEPILEQGETDYFIIFKDGTSGKETYGAARYLYATPPGPDGRIVVDFNKAYNPPCAFTPYATCPLPPPGNRLPFRIEAGEKKYAGGHA
jgi:uncharacterized protein (DUF1684 family)